MTRPGNLDEHSHVQAHPAHARGLAVIDDLDAGNLFEVANLRKAWGWSLLWSKRERNGANDLRLDSPGGVAFIFFKEAGRDPRRANREWSARVSCTAAFDN
jgi:hypothetical protein